MENNTKWQQSVSGVVPENRNDALPYNGVSKQGKAFCNSIADDRIAKIREAEKSSHIDTYSRYNLFEQGSWLEKPVKTIMEILPRFKTYSSLHVLDLGSGVGRNSIPLAKEFSDIPCTIDCVDHLPMAIDKLKSNAEQYGVQDKIRGIVSSIEQFQIQKDGYDLILSVSALEHVASEEHFIHKLTEIRDGLHRGGAVCLIINSEVTEKDLTTNKPLLPQFEVNFSSAKLKEILFEIFSAFEILKETENQQQYDIPRGCGMVNLTSTVITFVAKKGDAFA